MAWFTLLVFSCSAALYLWYYVRLVFMRLPPPPGPRGRFFSGNAHQLPKSCSWLTFTKWGQEYGPVIQFRTYSRRFVILNTAEAVNDLLEKRSAIYSDRPMAWMLFHLCGRGLSVFNISSLHERHRKYRKLIHAGLSARAVQAIWPMLQSEMQVMLRGFLEEPGRFVAPIRRNAAAVIMMTAYGYKVNSEDDEFIAAAEETSQITGWAMAPGRWLVDSYPILRFLPSWLPGAGFKRQAQIWRRRFDYLSDVPHSWVKTQIAEGKHLESFTSRLLLREDGTYPDGEEEDVIRWSAGGLYAGAADTTVSALISFLMLMALHPDVQRHAQAELDERIGRDSIPSYAQLDDLRYLTAVLKEVLRYAPVGPLALPHKLVQDDEYIGLRIEKDSTIIANVWAIMHDTKNYPSPETFDPSRFLRDTEKHAQADPRKFAFGFGARTCPGQQFAEKSLLLSMSSVLSHFTITPVGKVSLEDVEVTTGITSHIKAFECTYNPR